MPNPPKALDITNKEESVWTEVDSGSDIPATVRSE